ncbi:MAG: PAS domain S-box protein [Melioribacteraceae bacterium]|jgi:PAS domain S-box-containing protein|nr:PAS domain S-box protein [Melioribacteraceae bacterium]
MKKQKTDFIKFTQRWGILSLISLALVLIGFEIVTTYLDFNFRSNKTREEFISQQQALIKQEVNHAVDFIDYKTLFVDSVDENTKKELLETINLIRFGKEGYVFVNRFNGDALVSNGNIFSGEKKLWEVFPKDVKKTKALFEMEYNAAQKPEGDFIYYSFAKLTDSTKESPKVSFIYGIPSLQWLVGAGVYLDDVEKDIALMKSILIDHILINMIYTIVIVIVIIAFFLLLINIQFKKLKNDFDQFNLFFKEAAYEDEPIKLEKIKFSNFEEMAKNANIMLNDKMVAQQEVRDEKEQLFVTIRSVGDGLITTDNTGKVELMNTVAEKLTGWSNEEAKGKELNNVFNIVNENTRKQVENPVGRAIAENIIIGLANHTILISKDGTEYNIADSAAPIKDTNNNIRGVVLVFRDITEEYKIQEELRQSEIRYNRLSDLTYEGILIHKNGIAIDVNSALERISGYTAEELIGKNIIQLLVLKKYHKILFQNMQSEVIAPYEIEGIRKDGLIAKLEIESQNIGYKLGSENIRVTAIRDITEKSKMLDDLVESKKKAENASKLKSVFLAQMSHEIRTPINALVSMSSLLRYDFEDEANQDQLMSFEIIDRAGGRIIRTVDLLLNLSEIQTGTYEINSTLFNLYVDVLSLVIAGNKSLAEKKKIKLNLNSTSIDSDMLADYYTVNQIFVQLIDNAIKYTKEGEVCVTIDKNELGQLVVEIKDSGIGIEEEYLPKLFEPFSQEEMGYTRQYEGNGIGMALVKEYCKLNNAEIKVESKKGVGTIFRVVFN